MIYYIDENKNDCEMSDEDAKKINIPVKIKFLSNESVIITQEAFKESYDKAWSCSKGYYHFMTNLFKHNILDKNNRSREIGGLKHRIYAKYFMDHLTEIGLLERIKDE